MQKSGRKMFIFKGEIIILKNNKINQKLYEQKLLYTADYSCIQTIDHFFTFE